MTYSRSHWIVFAFLLFSLSQSGRAEDWPTYMRDKTRQGHTREDLQTPFALRWTYTAEQPPKRAWPGPEGRTVEGLKLKHRVRFDDVFQVAAVGSYVYFGSSVDNCVHCVETESGREKWRFFTGGPIRLAPTIADGRLYVGSDDGVVYCLDPSDGHLDWKFRVGPSEDRILARGRVVSRWPVRTDVLVDGGVAYFGAGIFPYETVYLCAVDAETGKTLWKNDAISHRDASRNDLSPQGYLLATKEKLFVPSGRTLPAAFDRATGELLHKQLGGGKQIGGWQAVLDKDQILSVGEHHILSLHQETGSIDNRLRGKQIALSGNMAYLADGQEISAINRERFAEVEREREVLEAEYAKLDRAVRRHVALVQRKRVHDTRTELKKLEQELQDLSEQGKGSAARLKELEAQRSHTEKSLAVALEQYEKSREEYNDLANQLKTTGRKKRALVSAVVKWRTPSSSDSVMITGGRTLFVGGVDDVLGIDRETGKTVFEAKVDGETRGLAIANGHLYVSTTTGRIYCFADARSAVNTPQPERSEIAEPYPEDDLTPLYARAAEEILQNSGVKRGFCLVLGSEEGRLAYELAKRTELSIHCLETDPRKVHASREALSRTGLYGHRVTVDPMDTSLVPFPSYFANLIVSERLLLRGRMASDPLEVARCLKPAGGVIVLGAPETVAAAIRDKTRERARSWLTETGLPAEGATTKETRGSWIVLRRGTLPDTAPWSHQYGNSGNTATIEDHRVRGSLRVLWYGDPGPGSMLNRHSGAVGPVAAGGRFYVQTTDSLLCYDAYNGVFLWEKENPDVLRTGVFNNYEPGNLVATEDTVFMVSDDKCLQIEAATGEVSRTHTIPRSEEVRGRRQWGYVAYSDGVLYGTSTIRKMILEEARRRGRPAEATATDGLFAVDTESGHILWRYEGKNIAHTSIAVGDGSIFFIDSTISAGEREHLLRAEKTELRELSGEARRRAEEEQKKRDVRRAVGLDSWTGETLWDREVDVTDCSGIGIGAGQLTLIYDKGHVVLCGANANGHYWSQFLAGEFRRRRLVVLSAASGDVLWARDANYRHRPIVVGDRIIAEPWAFDLRTGNQELRIHPITGAKTPWKFIRPGHHCGAIAATPNMLLFRSLYTAFYDLEADSGTAHFAGHRLGCWINAIPADGLVLIPEASAGCACLFSMTATIAFEPRENRQTWGVYSAEGSITPVEHLAVNLGAPGDRRDARGKLWLGYPRPSSWAGLDLHFDLQPTFVAGGTFVARNEESYRVVGSEPEWVFSSEAVGLSSLRLPLVGRGQRARTYTVRLCFSASPDDSPGGRVFAVKLQGETALDALDITAQTGGANRALVMEFKDVAVSDDLLVELVPSVTEPTISQAPALCGVEVIRTGGREILR